jgi:histidine ammonia-lyase
MTSPPIYLRLPTLRDDLEASLQDLRGEGMERVRRSRAVLDAALASGKPLYGVNTGFGVLASTRISSERLEDLQTNLLLSHAVGVSEPLPRLICELMLKLKIHALGIGFSGVSERTLGALLALDAHGLIPVVPSRGSVGASGDLAPLAHLSLPLIGQGHLWTSTDGPADAALAAPAIAALAAYDLAPIRLAAKDGLALINGTQYMLALGAYVMSRSLWLVRLADILATMSIEALQGSIRPFDARIHAVRPHPGQQDVAHNVRLLLRDSQILESHRDCGKVQDPYSLRCVPQVHGASRDALTWIGQVIERELNAVTDNPLVFPCDDDPTNPLDPVDCVVSGGNFHGQPLAISLDAAAIALAELASISERRTYLLLGGHDGLPRLLMNETGIHSGFMIPQYTAAALVSENKVLCHPASVDSIPTCLGQEDHVSMGSISAHKLLQVMKNVEHVLAIELMCASQALDYRAPLLPGGGVAAAHQIIRDAIPHREADGIFYNDLQHALRFVTTPELVRRVADAGFPLR